MQNCGVPPGRDGRDYSPQANTTILHFEIYIFNLKHEGSRFSKKNLRKMQDSPAETAGACHLRESEAQAEARIKDKIVR